MTWQQHLPKTPIPIKHQQINVDTALKTRFNKHILCHHNMSMSGAANQLKEPFGPVSRATKPF